MIRAVLVPLLAMAVAAACCASEAELDAAGARAAILDGVSSIHGGLHPGFMVALGPGAAAIALYPDAADGPMVAAAVCGKGRIIAVPDHQMLDMDQFHAAGDSGRFYENGLRWLAGEHVREKVILCTRREVAEHLQQRGYGAARHSARPAAELDGADVVVGWLGPRVPAEDLAAIRAFVERGGGLFLAEYGAGYDMWWKRPVHEAPGNVLLRGTGIAFAGEHRWDEGVVAVQPAEGPSLTAIELLALIRDEQRGGKPREIEAAAAIRHFASALSPGDALQSDLDAAISQRLVRIMPTPDTPVKDSFDKALLTREAAMLQRTPPRDVRPHRTVEAIYGVVPRTAERVSTTASIDTDNARWLPTGLYVPPGEVVTLDVPDALVGKGYRVRINAHTDDISRRPEWERPPVVHRAFPIDAGRIEVASAFGGSLFIDVGGRAPRLGRIDIHVTGAVRQPFFVLGRNTDEEWNRTLKHHAAPFGVLVGRRLIICMPTHDLLKLSEPQALMNWWDRVVELQDQLAAQADHRTSPELMNIDVQISAGAAHSGYPYQCYDRHWNNPADFDELSLNGSWGDFHEMGHNHQRNHWWTFDGDVEVTVNIFSSYVMQMMTPDATGGWTWVLSREKTLERARRCWASGRRYFEEGDVGTRLTFYLLLAHELGWEPFHRVFASYEADAKHNPSALPRNKNQEKIDQWLVRFSKASGRNLTPYMRDRWGLPVSDEAAAEVASLPPFDIE